MLHHWSPGEIKKKSHRSYLHFCGWYLEGRIVAVAASTSFPQPFFHVQRFSPASDMFFFLSFGTNDIWKLPGTQWELWPISFDFSSRPSFPNSLGPGKQEQTSLSPVIRELCYRSTKNLENLEIFRPEPPPSISTLSLRPLYFPHYKQARYHQPSCSGSTASRAAPRRSLRSRLRCA